MDARFLKAITFIIDNNEGGLNTDRRDAGGTTNYGISLRALKGFGTMYDINNDGIINEQDIRRMTKEQAIEIYHDKYFTPTAILLNDKNVFLQHLDMSINAGKFTATVLLQSVIGARRDGRFGEETLQLANMTPNLYEKYVAKRLAWYQALATKKPQYVWAYNDWCRRSNQTKYLNQ